MYRQHVALPDCRCAAACAGSPGPAEVGAPWTGGVAARACAVPGVAARLCWRAARMATAYRRQAHDKYRNGPTYVHRSAKLSKPDVGSGLMPRHEVCSPPLVSPAPPSRPLWLDFPGGACQQHPPHFCFQPSSVKLFYSWQAWSAQAGSSPRLLLAAVLCHLTGLAPPPASDGCIYEVSPPHLQPPAA